MTEKYQLNEDELLNLKYSYKELIELLKKYKKINTEEEWVQYICPLKEINKLDISQFTEIIKVIDENTLQPQVAVKYKGNYIRYSIELALDLRKKYMDKITNDFVNVQPINDQTGLIFTLGQHILPKTDTIKEI